MQARTPQMNWDEVLELMVEHCSYAEDLDAVQHFVFHPRMNGCSNVCLMCGHGTSEFWHEDDAEDDAKSVPWEVDDRGHASFCSYAQARRKLEPKRGELAAHIKSA